jgi:hypothetical protein
MGFLRRRSRSPEDVFRDEMARRILAVRGVTGVEPIEGFGLRVTRDTSEHEQSVYLSTVFKEVQSLGADAREERLRRFVSGMVDRAPRPTTWDAARALVRPAVRASSWVLEAPQSETLVRRPLAPFLSDLVVIDDADSMAYVYDSDLESWGIDEGELRATAIDNLWDDGIPIASSRLTGAIDVTGPDGYNCSFLATPDRLAALRNGLPDSLPALGDELLALAPHRDVMALIGTDDVDHLRHALDRVLEVYQDSARQLSPVPYTVTEDGIAPWSPPADHPLRPAVDLARAHLALVEYGHQKRRLDALMAKAGEDVHVAAFIATRNQATGRVLSTTTWPDAPGVALLPETDAVAFVQRDQTLFHVDWDRVVEIAADHLVHQDLDPPRWRVEGWPPPAVMTRLRDVGWQLGR